MQPEPSMPAARASAFDHAGRVLAALASQTPGDGECLRSWLAMAAQAGALVDGHGRSHLAALIEHDKRLVPIDWTGDSAMPAAYAEVAKASRAAGWRGADGEAILAAALMRGDSRALEWVAGLGEGIPAFEHWAAIPVARLQADGRGHNFAAPHLPAPCAWAAIDSQREAAALDWWIKRGIPLPERVLDHATPRTLPWLLRAGQRVDDATLAAWRARKAAGSVEPLQSGQMKAMFDILAKTRPEQAGQTGVLHERTASVGRSIIEKAVLTCTFSHVFDEMFKQWRQAGADEGVPDGEWPPLVAAQGGWLLRNIKTPVPWWAAALTACMASNNGCESLDGLFERWGEAAGAAPRFSAEMPAEQREALLGLALWAAWAVAGTKLAGNGGRHIGDYGKVIQGSAAHARAHVRRVMGWAGLDEAGAGRCMARALELSAKRALTNNAIVQRLRAGLRGMLLDTFSNHAPADSCGQIDCGALTGVLEAGVLPRDLVGVEHLAAMQMALPNEQGLCTYSRNPASAEDRVRVAGDLLAAMGVVESTGREACAERVARMLAAGVRPSGDGWPVRWKDSPFLRALMAQASLLEMPAGGERRRRLG